MKHSLKFALNIFKQVLVARLYVFCVNFFYETKVMCQPIFLPPFPLPHTYITTSTYLYSPPHIHTHQQKHILYTCNRHTRHHILRSLGASHVTKYICLSSYIYNFVHITHSSKCTVYCSASRCTSKTLFLVEWFPPNLIFSQGRPNFDPRRKVCAGNLQQC